MNMKWDNDLGENGSVNLDVFLDYLGTAIIYIIYILDYEDTDLYYKLVNLKKENKLKLEEFDHIIKTMIIDTD